MSKLLDILFLDLDGVLNSYTFSKKNPDLEFPYGLELDPKACSLLASFLKDYPEIKVVICSSWRDTLSVEQFNEILSPVGITVFDKTSDSIDKGPSVELWIQTNSVSSFVILDDDILFNLKSPMHKHQVKTSFHLGIQEEHIENMKEVLRFKSHI